MIRGGASFVYSTSRFLIHQSPPSARFSWTSYNVNSGQGVVYSVPTSRFVSMNFIGGDGSGQDPGNDPVQRDSGVHGHQRADLRVGKHGLRGGDDRGVDRATVVFHETAPLDVSAPYGTPGTVTIDQRHSTFARPTVWKQSIRPAARPLTSPTRFVSPSPGPTPFTSRILSTFAFFDVGQVMGIGTNYAAIPPGVEEAFSAQHDFARAEVAVPVGGLPLQALEDSISPITGGHIAQGGLPLQLWRSIGVRN